MNSFMEWLPVAPKDWLEQLKASDKMTSESDAADRLWALSRYRLDNLQLNSLHRRVAVKVLSNKTALRQFSTVRLALLSSSTIEHLKPAIEITAFRRRMRVEIYQCPFGQYRQDVLDSRSGLFSFNPDVVLFALDTHAVPPPLDLLATAQEVDEAVRAQVADWKLLWDTATQKGWTVIHQTMVVPYQELLGHLDTSTAGSPRYWYQALNQRLIGVAKDAGILLFDVDGLAAHVGKERWLDEPMWHHAKQPFSPQLAQVYADHLARLLAAVRGLSKKCLVLDLDNTLWGGVIGDDGLEKIEVGQGGGVGEAFVAFQTYVRQLKARGVVLAVCSKNDVAIARMPFEKHPDMVLKLDDFAAFVANWQDKASNIRAMAADLRLGLDSFVFFDDNPVERHLIRQELPEVEVPDVPVDPAQYVSCLSNAGYFEAVAFTRDDAQRSGQYLANQKRAAIPTAGKDLDTFLKSLEMTMISAPFDDTSRSRISQLINKSNQFNLTTHRYTEKQVELLQHDPNCLTLQVRLEDLYGDNGLISVVILKPLVASGESGRGWLIDTWLMSCRVLGRQVEHEVLNTMVAQAKKRGAEFLQGDYIPTAKNALVRDHYAKLGFSRQSVDSSDSDAPTTWRLTLASYRPIQTFIKSTYIEGALQNV